MKKQQLHDETIQHVFSLLILEIISLIRKKITDNPSHYSRKVISHISIFEIIA